MTKLIRLYCLAVIPLALVPTVSADERPVRPNIILILADDLGWQDVKCYDVDEPSPMETPNIDALAQRGVMFWQAVTPSRQSCRKVQRITSSI